jgi:pimeloyl-ACP methyl ester carboxylesterase
MVVAKPATAGARPPRFSRRTGFHCITYDARGHGESAWAQDGDYALSAYCSARQSGRRTGHDTCSCRREIAFAAKAIADFIRGIER